MTGAIVLGSGILTMTSREIAELTGKEHGNVMRDIRAMLEAISTDSNLNPCANSSSYTGKDGRQYPQYELDKNTCLTLLLGYDPVARMKVVKRWQELEAAGHALDLSTDEGRLQLIQELSAQQLALVRENKEQAKALAEAAPKAEFVDNYVQASTGSMGFRQVCKLLKVKEPVFRDFLLAEKIMYYLGGALTAHKNHQDAGRFECKTDTSATGHNYVSTKFTPKGVTWVAGEWAKHQARLALAEVAE